MGADLEHPERLVGLHFFNPVKVLPLVELIRTDETDDVTVATTYKVATDLRKRPVLAKDAPGFIVNRVLTRMTGVLMDALEHGNSVEETDEAVLRLGLPMAPSVLLQMVGPRVANHVLETMNESYPDRFPLSPTLANYAEGKDEIVVAGEQPRSVEEITDAVLEAIADEVRHMLDEGVVAEAADVDTALILGAGWPFWLGGVTKYLDQTGVSERVAGRPLAEYAAAPALRIHQRERGGSERAPLGGREQEPNRRAPDELGAPAGEHDAARVVEHDFALGLVARVGHPGRRAADPLHDDRPRAHLAFPDDDVRPFVCVEPKVVERLSAEVCVHRSAIVIRPRAS